MNVNTEFNQKLIETITECIPTKPGQIDLLMEITFMSKEAAYRRLRGDVPFTFSEACLLANKLNLSLDEIALSGNSKRGKPSFELRIHPNDLLSNNFQKLYEHVDSYDRLFNTTTDIMTTWNMIPYSIFLPYENLSNIYIFRWIYQTQNKNESIKFSEVVIPEYERNKARELGKRTFIKADYTYIFDRSIFSSFINELKYFRGLNLISETDLVILKKEFYELINDLEVSAAKGKNKAGNTLWLYLSNIDFDHNYTYIEGPGFQQAYMDNIYLTDSIVSYDPDVCNMHKKWIESLRKYSTLISVSGEKERKQFFDEQRRLLEELT